jgi:diacylglycerol O-acyltransferase / wax synthase
MMTVRAVSQVGRAREDIAVKHRMSMLDSSFIRMERHESPQHAAILAIFRIPRGSPPDYLRQLAARMRSYPVTRDRFNWVLSKGLVDKVLPAWEVLPPDRIVLDYHFRHSALPQPGGDRELALLVSQLVTHPIDLNRPAWEIHLIEGLEGGRFAILTKMHHALIDGITAVKMFRNWLSEDPTETDAPPLWANKIPGLPVEREPRPATASKSPLVSLAGAATDAITSVPAVAGAVGAAMAAAQGHNDGLVAPYTAPRSIFNGPITQRRRVSTQRISTARVEAIAKHIDGTLNDAIAVVLGGAIRRYLRELDALPDRSAVCGVLASLRATVDETTAESAGNVISFIFADIATDTGDITERAHRVVASTRAGKEHLLGLGKHAVNYSSLMLAPFIFTSFTGTGHHFPMFNVALSNVPGVPVPMYWNGALAEAVHGTTIITSGEALVVTVASWHDNLCFTFTACPDTIPHPQRLSVYLTDALQDVETALLAPVHEME